MRTATVHVMGEAAGLLEEHEAGRFVFRYLDAYDGPPVSLSMPVARREHSFDRFPPFFEGLLPKGKCWKGCCVSGSSIATTCLHSSWQSERRWSGR